MVKTVDHDARRKAVLSSAINMYIREAEPVASEDLSLEFDLSPATIRNIFAELEESGYLTHPHTSAGRTPTDKGYRYYVDFLLAQLELIEEEKTRIFGAYERGTETLDAVLEKTSDLISEVTHCAGIASLLDMEDKFVYKGVRYIIEQPEFQDAVSIRFLIRLIEEKRRLLDIIRRHNGRKVAVYIGEELGCEGTENCAILVSTYNVRERPVGRLAVLGPRRMEYGHAIPALEYVAEVLSEVLTDI
ncbi:MAG: DeoR family transcriptional regulator [Candidatus Omnitrophota bacterium]|jgi:transcriptional regulator of heat shock response